MFEKLFFGKLTLNAIPYHVPIVMGATAFIFLLVLVVLGTITFMKRWGWLWREWLTTVDHKKIGIMYMIGGLIMLVRGLTDAALMRSQQALAYGSHLGYLPPEHYDQIFTAHGVIMIFFMAMAFVFGLINYIVPLQIGARDVAFPYLNSLSFWLYAGSAVLVNISLFVGKFAATGWLAYPPLSELAYSPGVGVDYYLWSLSISGIATLLGGINIFVTIIKMRAPGMTFMRMPLFTWSCLCAVILVVVSFPLLNITLFMLFLDRFMGMHFFTSGFGGNPMLYINLIWTWGHPEVYILVLPAFGIFSEVIATFSRKTLFGYAMMVWATFAITFLAFTVWLHHFFTMGAGADVNAFFGIATMIISIPTGVKIFNWLATMYRGRITFELPMMWSIAFLITFSIGGMTGVMMAVPGVDFQVHNSLFLVAHFHNTIIGGVVFGLFAGITYWWPKMFGFKLNDRLGKCSFWCWFIGFYVAFMPLYILGLKGMTRRLNHYTNVSWHIYLVVAAIGALMIIIGVLFQVVMIIVSIKNRNHPDYKVANDPWDARALEWETTSPPPFYNFAHDPEVLGRDAHWLNKENGSKPKTAPYTEIHMPRNTSCGFWVGVISCAFGFAMVWDSLLVAAVTGLAMLIFIIVRTFDFNIDYFVKSDEVAKIESNSLEGAK